MSRQVPFTLSEDRTEMSCKIPISHFNLANTYVSLPEGYTLTAPEFTMKDGKPHIRMNLTDTQRPIDPSLFKLHYDPLPIPQQMERKKKQQKKLRKQQTTPI